MHNDFFPGKRKTPFRKTKKDKTSKYQGENLLL